VTSSPVSRVSLTMNAMPLVDDLVSRPPQPAESALSFDMPRERWRELFADLADGRMTALEQLYRVTARRLYGFALWVTGSPEDAADVVAETMVRVAEQRDRLRQVKDPRAWLLAVSRRLGLDILRRKSRRPSEPLEAAALVTAPESDRDRLVDAGRVSTLLAALPGHHREVVYLRHFGDCTFATIGRVVGVPTFTAASRYRLAIRRLRRLLEETP
jgi:RNA polymerase sigma-70 factor, ECF subfamily